ncbi:MAG: hypothetical protein GX808_12620 [Syntrophomonadaceae bacterium]|nr:hypothetical protein [Syntrophomonadaceae bacterium]
MLRTENRLELETLYEATAREEAELKAIRMQAFNASDASSATGVRYSLDHSTLDSLQDRIQYVMKGMIPFKTLLSSHITKSRFRSDPEFYHKCGISRQHFSKIMGRELYIPKKKTVMAMALTLRLSLEDTKELLASAGFTFVKSDKTDIVVHYCIEHQLYDLDDVNEALVIFNEKPLLE